jgi:hypothetical protein
MQRPLGVVVDTRFVYRALPDWASLSVPAAADIWFALSSSSAR